MDASNAPGPSLDSVKERLRVQGLQVVYRLQNVKVRAIDDVSLEIREKEFVAIVGESGSGKSTLALAIIGLLPRSTEISGNLEYNGENLLALDDEGWNKIRGNEIGMIFQEPLSSLNPITKIGEQMAEALQRKNSAKVYDHSPGKAEFGRSFRTSGLMHRKIPAEIYGEIIRWLKLVRIPDPESVVEKYSFELSGGMMQRIMIAMVLSQNPSLLLADEPTTALDVTTQAQILKLMLNLRKLSNASVIFVTHDLAVGAHVADRVIVMYAGDVVEDASTEQIFSNPLHPYTQALIRCFPQGHKSQGALGTIPGNIIDLKSEVNGCKFADRCEFVKDACREGKPRYVESEKGHYVRCTKYY